MTCTRHVACAQECDRETPAAAVIHWWRDGAFHKGQRQSIRAWQRGHIGFYFDYMLWQRQALHKTRRLGLDSADIKHHVSFGAILPGSHLANLGPPFVFGRRRGGHLSGRELRGMLERSMLRDAAGPTMIKHLAPLLPPPAGRSHVQI